MRRVDQYERTDRDITNALLARMEQMTFEKITVQDILDEARINRTTFYRHFPDKYAVLERLQEKTIGDMTRCLDETVGVYGFDLQKINLQVYSYITKHRQTLRKLIAVRSKNLDMEGQMSLIFMDYLSRSDNALNDLEMKITADIYVRFFLFLLDHEFDEQAFSTLTMDTFLDLMLYFFRVDKVPGAREKLLEVIGSMHWD